MGGHRKNNRLLDYHYSSDGYYFITVIVKDRYPIFGNLFFENVQLSVFGKIALKCLFSLEQAFPFIKLDEFIIMPDHIHLILEMRYQSKDNDLNRDRSCMDTSRMDTSPKDTSRKDLINQVLTDTDRKSWILMQKKEMHLGKIIRHFKAKTSFLIHKEGLKEFEWVSRYYDKVIKDEKSLYFIRKYIQENSRRHFLKKVA